MQFNNGMTQNPIVSQLVEALWVLDLYLHHNDDMQFTSCSTCKPLSLNTFNWYESWTCTMYIHSQKF